MMPFVPPPPNPDKPQGPDPDKADNQSNHPDSILDEESQAEGDADGLGVEQRPSLEWVTLATFETEPEATEAKNRLTEAGIPNRAPYEESIGELLGAGVAGEFQIQVDARDSETARSVLVRGKGGARWKCPKCHEQHEGSFEVCWNCGTSREGVEDPAFVRPEEDEKAPPVDAAEEVVEPSGSARPPQLGRWRGGSLLLFRAAGTDVLIHWSWFVVAYFRINDPVMSYTSWVWNVAELFMAFSVVLLHEFGHVLACRQVGGTANRIVLWPLGGLAIAHAPPRPAALLWTIAAGPLVNVILVPISVGLLFLSGFGGWGDLSPDLDRLLVAFAAFNGIVLVFNLLPVFPLDGGQILQALLWFLIGRVPSLIVAASLGLVVGFVAIMFAVFAQDFWFFLMALFIVVCCLAGISRARLLLQVMRAPHHKDLTCPSCGSAPPVGEFWRCVRCLKHFDYFDPIALCPKGGVHANEASCLHCGGDYPVSEWLPSVLPAFADAGKLEERRES